MRGVKFWSVACLATVLGLGTLGLLCAEMAPVSTPFAELQAGNARFLARIIHEIEDCRASCGIIRNVMNNAG